MAALVVVLIGVAGGMAWFTNHHKTQNAAAGDALFIANEARAKELTALKSELSPLPADPASEKSDAAQKNTKPGKKDAAGQDKARLPDPEYARADVDGKFSKTLAAYQDVIRKFSGTHAELQAQLAIGDLYFDHGQAEKALPFYEKSVALAPAGRDRGLSYYSLGYAYEGTGKYTEAVSAYDHALKQGDFGLKGDLLLAKARSYEMAKNIEQARVTYDQIVKELPNTDYAKTAELAKSLLH